MHATKTLEHLPWGTPNRVFVGSGKVMAEIPLSYVSFLCAGTHCEKLVECGVSVYWNLRFFQRSFVFHSWKMV